MHNCPVWKCQLFHKSSRVFKKWGAYWINEIYAYVWHHQIDLTLTSLCWLLESSRAFVPTKSTSSLWLYDIVWTEIQLPDFNIILQFACTTVVGMQIQLQDLFFIYNLWAWHLFECKLSCKIFTVTICISMTFFSERIFSSKVFTLTVNVYNIRLNAE